MRLLRVDLQLKTRPTNSNAVLGLEDGGEGICYQAVKGDGPLKMAEWDEPGTTCSREL